MSEPAKAPASDTLVPPPDFTRLLLAYSSTVIMGGVVIADLVDMARGRPLNPYMLGVDVGATVLTGLGAYVNLTTDANKPENHTTVLFANLFSNGLLLTNLALNDQGTRYRRYTRGTAIPFNILGGVITVYDL